jgi:Uncharacterized conserved protein
MAIFRADTHIHTLLSPCGDIEMTPLGIVRRAREQGLDMIGITDHNSTLQCEEIRRIGEREGLYVLCGAEITTQEEVHCLVFVDWGEPLLALQAYIEKYLPPIPNNTDLFGYQLVVNEQEEVLYEAPYLLISALSQTIDQVEAEAHRLGGLFIPAHIDKPKNSLFSQLGFVPPGLKADALEIFRCSDIAAFRQAHPKLKYPLTCSSDAHYPNEIGRKYISLDMDSVNFENIKHAIAQGAP